MTGPSSPAAPRCAFKGLWVLLTHIRTGFWILLLHRRRGRGLSSIPPTLFPLQTQSEVGKERRGRARCAPPGGDGSRRKGRRHQEDGARVCPSRWSDGPQGRRSAPQDRKERKSAGRSNGPQGKATVSRPRLLLGHRAKTCFSSQRSFPVLSLGPWAAAKERSKLHPVLRSRFDVRGAPRQTVAPGR